MSQESNGAATSVRKRAAKARFVSGLDQTETWQRNCLNAFWRSSLPQVVLAMVATVGMLVVLALLGSHLITFGVIGGVILMIIVTVGIWSQDVTEWQHDEKARINPNMSADDIEESLRNDGLQETFRKTHHWNE